MGGILAPVILKKSALIFPRGSKDKMKGAACVRAGGKRRGGGGVGVRSDEKGESPGKRKKPRGGVGGGAMRTWGPGQEAGEGRAGIVCPTGNEKTQRVWCPMKKGKTIGAGKEKI